MPSPFAATRRPLATSVSRVISRLIGVWTVMCILMSLACSAATCFAGDSFSIPVWPGLAPGETSDSVGVAQPNRPNEVPPITRLVEIRKPTIDVFLPDNPCGTGVLVLPGGGFGKVVPDKEGSEAAPWLCSKGVAVFVLRYRTNEITPKTEPAWKRPLQDAQRGLSLMRANAAKWGLKPDQIGVLGFSAGGQVASILHTAEPPAYRAVDDIDGHSGTPDFSLLIYPWRVLQADGETLLPEIQLTEKSPPAFIVHTHDDGSSSLGSVLIYAGLKRHKVPAELHVYANGGHGYGMRAVAGSDIGTWPDRAMVWLQARGLASK